MTALARSRQYAGKALAHIVLVLASGTKAFKNGSAAIDLGTGKSKPASAEGDLLVIGRYDEDVDATGGDKRVRINLGREIVCEYWENGSSITAAMIGRLCYFADDQTVTMAPAVGGGPVAGRIWAVSEELGVLVERLGTPGGQPAIIGTLPAQVSNDFVLPATSVIPGAVYDVPATAAASTVTLPAGSIEGAEITFCADGTKNAHAITYRDVTGPVSLTAALAASKRHVVKGIFLGGKWHASAHVSP